MILYTDGSTKASTDQIIAALSDSQAADRASNAEGREATATEIQAIIDADEKLKSAGITAVADHQDIFWVAVQLPSDIDGQPKFWASQASTMGEDLGNNKVRNHKNRMQVELARISGLL